MNEDKKMILHDLLRLLWKTRGGHDVIDLQLYPDGKWVKVMFLAKGVKTYSKNVCIDCDSGLQMVIDICRALM